MRPPPSPSLRRGRQDVEAARRICDALRAAGIEVWFDQSELPAFAARLRRGKRGGDAWDQKIRWQIKECALFMPVISAHTQARPEGYFRLEWKLAVDRSHLVADDQPFLVPVAIDDTPQATARVPDKFCDVPWTRLVMTETPAAFAQRIQAFLRGAEQDGGRRTEDGGRRQRREDGESGTAAPRGGRGSCRSRESWSGSATRFGRCGCRHGRERRSRRPRLRGVAAPRSEARQLVAKARAMSVEKYDSPVRIHAALGRADEALPMVESALAAAGKSNVGWPLTAALLRLDPLWDKLRGVPEFQALLKEPGPDQGRGRTPALRSQNRIAEDANEGGGETLNAQPTGGGQAFNA